MRILYITSARLPTVKGHGYQIVKTCEALAKEHDVLLLAPLVDDRSVHDYYAAAPSFSIESRFHLDISYLRRNHDRVWFAIHLATFASAASLWILRHRKRFDLIYSRDPLSLYLLNKARGALQAPLVYECHEFPDDGHPFQIELAKRLDGLVVVTEQMKQRFVGVGVDSGRVLVEPDAVDLAQFDLSVSKEEARRKVGMPQGIIAATYAGRFHTMGMEKGIPETIDAAKELVAEFPSLHFYFVGGPEERVSRYRARIEANDLPQERFSFFEKQPVAELPYWLKASDILLMPHPENTFYSFYVSPLKMYEYMAARRPIVGSKLPAIEEVLVDDENALLAKPGSAEDIANAVKRLIADPELGEGLAENAFERVRRHTWDERARRIAAFTSSLL